MKLSRATNEGADADDKAPVKQRHTAKRIWQRLRAEHGFASGYTTVRDYVRQVRTRRREVFVPLAHRLIRLATPRSTSAQPLA